MQGDTQKTGTSQTERGILTVQIVCVSDNIGNIKQ